MSLHVRMWSQKLHSRGLIDTLRRRRPALSEASRGGNGSRQGGEARRSHEGKNHDLEVDATLFLRSLYHFICPKESRTSSATGAGRGHHPRNRPGQLGKLLTRV